MTTRSRGCDTIEAHAESADMNCAVSRLRNLTQRSDTTPTPVCVLAAKPRYHVVRPGCRGDAAKVMLLKQG